MNKLSALEWLVIGLAVIVAVLVATCFNLWNKVNVQDVWIIGLKADVEAMKSVNQLSETLIDQGKMIEAIAVAVDASDAGVD